MSSWHAFIPYNMIRFIAEDKAAVHVITFIKSDTSEHFCPCPELAVVLHQFTVDRLFFPFRVLLNKLRLNMLGMILELGIKQKRPVYIKHRKDP